MSPALQELRLTAQDPDNEEYDNFPYNLDEYCPGLHTLHVTFEGGWELSASTCSGTVMDSLPRMHDLRNLNISAAYLFFPFPFAPHVTQLGLHSKAILSVSDTSFSAMTRLQALTIRCDEMSAAQDLWGDLKGLNSLTHLAFEHRD